MCARSAWLRTQEVALLHSKDDHPKEYEKQVSAAPRSRLHFCSNLFLRIFQSSLSCHFLQFAVIVRIFLFERQPRLSWAETWILKSWLN